jgi:HEAT repeat protein
MALRRTPTREALREIVPRRHERDVEGLCRQLREGNVEQRRWAARDLAGELAVVPVLGERLLAEREPHVREAVFTSLTATPGEATVQVLLPLLRSDDPALRNGAIEALSAMPEAVAPRIARLLEDADDDVRLLTVNLLGELRHERVSEWLGQVLRREPTVNVVAAAIEVLTEIGGAADLEALRRAADRFADDPFVGFAASLAIERIEAV